MSDTVTRLKRSETGGAPVPAGCHGTGSQDSTGLPDPLDTRMVAWSTVCVAIAAVLFVFADTVVGAVDKWYNTRSYNHIFFILPICGYLLWERRQLLARLAPKPSLAGIAVVAAGALGWLLGETAGVKFVQQFALVMILQGIFLAVLGWGVVRRMAFPLLYLVFLVPFGDFLVPKLQDITAQFVVRGLQMIGIPVFLDGIFISIPSGNFEVAEACSGLRFLTASIALGVLFANIMYRSWWRRGVFFVLTLTVPIVANGLRALGIVLLAHYSDNQIAVGVDHLVYGWIFFSFVTAILFGLGMTFRDGGVDHANNHVSERFAPGRSSAIVGFGVIAVALAGLSPAYGAYVHQRLADSRVTTELALPAGFSNWTPVHKDSWQWQPGYLGADRNYHWQFREPGTGRTVDLHVVFYRYQRDGSEVVNSTNRLGDGGWQWVSNGVVQARVEGHIMTVPVSRLSKLRSKRVAAYWNWVDGRTVTNPIVAKALQVKAALLAGQASAAAVVVSAPYLDTPREANDAIQAFLLSAKPLGAQLESITRE